MTANVFLLASSLRREGTRHARRFFLPAHALPPLLQPRHHAAASRLASNPTRCCLAARSSSSCFHLRPRAGWLPPASRAFFAGVAAAAKDSQGERLKGAAAVATTASVAHEEAASAQADDLELLYEELKLVASELERHDRLYYEAGRPEISDDAYDALCAREEQMRRQNPHLEERLLASGGTTRKVRVGAGSDPPQSASAPAASSSAKKRRHLSRMQSLDNVHSEDDLLKWLQRVRKKLDRGELIRILTEPKLDGLSLSLRYVRGRLEWAATRGDGQRGQDVTQAALQYIPDLPTELQSTDGAPETLEVRGEAVMPTSAFRALTKAGGSDDDTGTAAATATVSNARNAAAGMLLRKQASNSSLPSSVLQFFAYDFALMNETSQEADNPRDGLDIRQKLHEWGFQVPEPTAVTLLTAGDSDEEWTIEDIQPMIEYSKRLQAHRHGLAEAGGGIEAVASDITWGDYDMDGCVHKVVEASIRDRLGSTSRAPKWATAHKLTPSLAVTKLLEIVTQVGRTGAITPVAVLEPVSLDGVVVQRATLHNFPHLQQLLGGNKTHRIGKNALVWVRRSGDVIPQVVSLVDAREHPSSSVPASSDAEPDDGAFISLLPPTHCPACGSETVVEAPRNNSGTGQAVRCGGPALLCPPRATLAVQHAFSRDALDVTGLSEARIRQLMENDLLRVPGDLFELVKNEGSLETLAQLEGWGPLSVQNLKRVTQRVAEEGVPFGKLLYALGIRSVGAQTAQLIANAYRTPELFWHEVSEASELLDDATAFPTLRQESELTRGVGPVIISALYSFAKDDQLTQAGRDLSTRVRIHEPDSSPEPIRESLERPWRGLSVVFTGSLPGGLSRSEAQRIANVVLGAKSTPARLSKSTNLLVVGENGGRKQDEAGELGVPCMQAHEFLELVEKIKGSS